MTNLVRKTDDEAGDARAPRLRRAAAASPRASGRWSGRSRRARSATSGRAADPAASTTRSRAASAARLGAAASAAGRGAQALVGRRPRRRAPAVGDAARRPRASRWSTASSATGSSARAARCTSRWRCASTACRWRPSGARSPRPSRPPPALVVFLHGLMETERGWRLGGREPYGARLRREPGLTPVYVRYNSGRHISENGRSLADLLERVVAEWPVEVEEVALVGHSMGGLVARSACHLGALDDAAVGRPGPARRLARLAAHGRAARAGRPLRRLRPQPAAGDADLRRLPAPPQRRHPRPPRRLAGRRGLARPRPGGAARRRLRRRCRCSRARRTASSRPPSPGARAIRWGGSSATRSCSCPARRAESRTRTLGFEAEYGLHVGATHHIALLNHPAVYEKLHAWLALADYPHVLDIPTRWKDNDVYGHVNNVEYYSVLRHRDQPLADRRGRARHPRRAG